MKNQIALSWLIPLIGLLALFAASMELFYQKLMAVVLLRNVRVRKEA